MAIGTIGETSPVAKARTWLARMGWRRHGLLGAHEGPRGCTRLATSASATTRRVRVLA
jgi:hypothetical protein